MARVSTAYQANYFASFCTTDGGTVTEYYQFKDETVNMYMNMKSSPWIIFACWGEQGKEPTEIYVANNFMGKMAK